MNHEAQRIMMEARTSLVLGSPFFGCLALGLELKEDLTCETAWVNGKHLGYNPEFVLGLSHDQRKALWAHEVDHCALGHPWRREGRDMKVWNIACDKAINSDLKQAGFTLPPDGHYATGDEVGKSAEWIFARLSEKPQQPPQGGGGKQKPQQGGQQGQGQGQGQQPQPGQGPQQPQQQPDPLGEVRDAPTGVDEDGEPMPTEQDWQQKTIQAMMSAKARGDMPAGAERSVREALEPRLDVRSLLLRFLTDRCASDYTWTKPSARYMPMGLYLPKLESNELGEVAVLVDTSGSMDEVALSYSRGIVQSVIDECKPKAVSLHFVDAKVCNSYRMERGEMLDWKPKGGGGTDFRSFFKMLDDEQSEAVCVIAITDCEAVFPQDVPAIPTIWLSTTRKVAPFGETVYLNR